MGRPLNKKYFGRLADSKDDRFTSKATESFFNITINVQVGTNSETDSGLILKQKSPSRFLVNDLKNGTAVTTDGKQLDGTNGTGNVGVCTLVDKVGGDLAANEMSIYGYISGAGVGGEPVRIKKFYNRTCRDFNNNRYSWEVQDDSSVTALILTAI